MYKMRLINLLVFFFAYYENTFARAARPLDLDNYDPELVKLKVDKYDNYNIENFYSTGDDGFNEVLESGVPVWPLEVGSEDQLQSVHVYTVRSAPQLMFLYLSTSNKYLRFKKDGIRFIKVDDQDFFSLKDKLTSGTLLSNEYVLDVKNTNNNRQFYTMNTGVVDGVSTVTFNPGYEFKLTKVNDGLLPVYTVDKNHLVTKVTAALENGIRGLPVGVTVTVVAKQENATVFFRKVNNTWVEVTGDDYKRLLRKLTPESVFGLLTLDLAKPAEEIFEVVKEFEPGVMKVHYTPMANFRVSKVVNEGLTLWASHDYTATKVHTYSAHNDLKLVKLTTKSPEGVVEDLNLERVSDGFAPLNDQAFSLRVKKLLKEGQDESKRELPPDDGEEERSEYQFPTSFPSRPEDGELVENLPLAEPVTVPKQTGSEYQFSTSFPTWPEGEEQPVTHFLDVLAPNENDFKVAHGTFRGVPVKMFTPKEAVDVKNVKVGDHEVWHTENGTKFLSAYLYFKDKQPKVVEVRVEDHGRQKVYNRLELDAGVWATQLPHYFDQFLNDAASPPSPGTALELDFNKFTNEHVTEENFELFGVKSTSYHAEEGYHFAKVLLGNVLLWDVKDHENAYLVKATGFLNKVLDDFGQVVLVELEGFLNGDFKTYHYSLEDNTWKGVDKKHFDKKFLDLRPKPEPEPVPEEGASGEPVHVPEGEFVALNLDTDNFDDDLVSKLSHKATEGYYFNSYTPKGNTMFKTVTGPKGFHFDGRGGKLATFVKFFYVHAQLLGARLDTVTSKDRTHPLTYYYTFKNGQWSFTTSEHNLVSVLTNALAFTEEQKKALEDALKADVKFKKTMEEVERKKQKEAEKKKKEEEEVKVPDKLSHKRKLFEDMVDFEQQRVPEEPVPVEETEDELEARKQEYAKEKLLVESELVYFELNQPFQNRFVHTKDYLTFGLKTLDVTPVVGKWVHVVAMHGKRVWVSATNKRCTNLQMYYEDDEVVGAVLRVTTAKGGQLKTGEDFDYLFLLEGELKKVTDRDFVTLANRRFQKVALASLSKL